MTKLEKIKEYLMINNITQMSGCHCDFPDGIKARYTLIYMTQTLSVRNLLFV
jgi:hypothetical protein